MKIRNKYTWETIEVQGNEGARAAVHPWPWTKVSPETGTLVYYSSEVWEPAPVAPVWRDVTAECEVDEGGRIFHRCQRGRLNVTARLAEREGTYRLRAVNLLRNDRDPLNVGDYKLVPALTVEHLE